MEKRMKRKIWSGEKMAKKTVSSSRNREYKEKRSPGARTQKPLRKGGEAGRASSRRV